MKEIYKVRKIEIDLYSSPVQESQLSIECEFGIIIEKEGVLFLETHIFDKELFDKIIVGGCVKMHTLFFFYDKAPTFPSRGFVIT